MGIVLSLQLLGKPETYFKKVLKIELQRYFKISTQF